MPLSMPIIKQADWGKELGEGFEKAVENYYRYKRLALERESLKSQMQHQALRTEILGLEKNRKYGEKGEAAYQMGLKADTAEDELRLLLSQVGSSKKGIASRRAVVDATTATAKANKLEAENRLKTIPGAYNLKRVTDAFELDKINLLSEQLGKGAEELLKDPRLRQADLNLTLEILDRGSAKTRGGRAVEDLILRYLSEGPYASPSAKAFYNNKKFMKQWREAEQNEKGRMLSQQRGIVLGEGGQGSTDVTGPKDLFGNRDQTSTKSPTTKPSETSSEGIFSALWDRVTATNPSGFVDRMEDLTRENKTEQATKEYLKLSERDREKVKKEMKRREGKNGKK